MLEGMDPPESFAADYEGEEEPKKVSRLTVLGAIFLPFGIVAALLLFFPLSVTTTGSTQPETAWWQWLLRFTLLPLGIASPFVTTILGLALMDALFYPLLALDGLLVGLGFWLIRRLLEMKFLTGLLINIIFRDSCLSTSNLGHKQSWAPSAI